MAFDILNDLVVVLGLSVVVTVLFHRIKVPTIVALLVTGVLVGPHGLGLIKAVHEVEILAEIGIIFLLFTIGIHFSLKSLAQMKKAVLLGGALQVFLTILGALGVLSLLGRSFTESMFMGWLLALSSTAIVLKQLEERAEIDSPHGRNATAFLIFQDIIIFPMILFTPLLVGASQNIGETVAWLAVKVMGILVFVLISAEYIVPKILYQIVKTRSRELFLLTVVVICFAVAGLTAYAGLSLSLGAFLAGLIISESEYSHQALGNVVPFQALFMSLFFISVGMLLDMQTILDHPVLIGLLVPAVLILKTGLATVATFLLGFPLRTCLLVGLTLSQIGEFSFLLSGVGLQHGLLTQETYQVFLAVSLITMAATPLMIAIAPRIADSAANLPLPARLKTGLVPGSLAALETNNVQLHDHLIVVGFGINGRNVTRAARRSGIPYVILEMNPDTVREERARSEPISFGDATEPAVLKHAGAQRARVLVVAISDAAATRKIAETAKHLNPNLYVIARTRFLQEMAPLYELGADDVVPEEFETSVEIFTRVLRKYLVPQDEIDSFVSEIRSEGYEMFRTPSLDLISPELKLHIPDIEISTFRISEKSPLVGRSLHEVDLRRKYGITVLLIRRNSTIHSHPDAHTRLQSDDLITVLGKPEKIASAGALFKA